MADGTGPHGAVEVEVALAAYGAGPHCWSEHEVFLVQGQVQFSRVVLATVVIALPGIGQIEGHQFLASGQGAAFGSAVLCEVARHFCQLQEKGVSGASRAWSGYD